LITMPRLRRQSLVAYGAPLCETIVDCPQPRGPEVLVRVERCGVCHSDLHMQDGYFSLAGDKRLDVSAGRTLPFTLGHEIAGVIEAAGPDVAGDAAAAPGRKVAVYPWIGCGVCPACRQGAENLCSDARHLGIAADGGFASHVLAPHPRYLLDYAPLSPSLAGMLMCSGLTAYAALKRLQSEAARGPVLLVGLGGVGMMGLALARTLFKTAPLVADIDAGKREAALKAGAAAAFDPADPAARKAVMKATGGVHGVCDFAGSEASLAFSTGVLAKGGKAVITGLIGGGFAMPAAMFVLRAMTIEGVLTGTLADAEELMALVRAGHIPAVPVAERPLAEAQAALDDLRAGRVVGRVVLTG
jgi:alcohol dehydrogenase